MRIQIAFVENEIKDGNVTALVNESKQNPFIYLHWGFRPDDKEYIKSFKGFIKEFHRHRGHDIAYLTFWLSHFIANRHIKAYEKYETAFSYEDFKYNVLSHGIDSNIHGDIEFFYIISPDNIYCLKPLYKDYEIYDFALIKTIQIKQALKLA